MLKRQYKEELKQLEHELGEDYQAIEDRVARDRKKIIHGQQQATDPIG